jgi:hypothetical protein
MSSKGLPMKNIFLFFVLGSLTVSMYLLTQQVREFKEQLNRTEVGIAVCADVANYFAPDDEFLQMKFDEEVNKQMKLKTRLLPGGNKK